MRAVKKYTSKRIIEAIKTSPERKCEWMLNIFSFKTKKHKRNKSYQVRTQKNQTRYLYSPNFIREQIEYIHENPVSAGIVEKPGDYLYSSARN